MINYVINYMINNVINNVIKDVNQPVPLVHRTQGKSILIC